jgi:hypothetical protein
MMRKGIVVALAVTGSLVVGPAALAATAEPSGFLPGAYRPQHSGHDHGKKSDHGKKHGKGKKDDHHGHGDGDHGHGGHGHGHHHHHDDGAHASGGYDSHRSHPRQYSTPIRLTTAASGDVLEHGQEPADDDHDHDGDGKPDHDPEDHDEDEKPKPKPKPGN